MDHTWIFRSLLESALPHFIHVFIYAIMDCNKLVINFSNSIKELEDSAEGFQKISSGRIIDGCVACVDGILLSIRTTSPNEIGNVTIPVTMMNLESRPKQHVTVVAALFMCQLLHPVRLQTLLHTRKLVSAKWLKICHWENMLLGTMHTYAQNTFSLLSLASKDVKLKMTHTTIIYLS